MSGDDFSVTLALPLPGGATSSSPSTANPCTNYSSPPTCAGKDDLCPQQNDSTTPLITAWSAWRAGLWPEAKLALVIYPPRKA